MSRSAERLVVELKNRLSLPDGVVAAVAGASGAPSVLMDVREALGQLGYGAEEIREALRDLDSTVDASTLLRDALKVLGARRA